MEYVHLKTSKTLLLYKAAKISPGAGFLKKTLEKGTLGFPRKACKGLNFFVLFFFCLSTVK